MTTGSAGASVAARLNALPVTSLHRRATVVIGIGFFFDLYESFLSGILAVSLKSLGGGTTGKTLLLASVYLGSFVGALVMSRFADRLGRRRAFLVTLGVYALFSLLAAFAPTLPLLIAARFLAGAGIGAELPLGAVYLADLMPARVRGRFVALAFTIGFCGMPVAGFAGRYLAPNAPLGIEGWRILLAAGALGAVIIALLRRNLPESPRWLESVGRTEEAERVLAMLTDRARAEHPDADLTPAAEPAPSRRPALRELFTGPWRRSTTMLWIFHVFQTVGYYGFGTMVPLVLQAKGFEITSTLTFTALSYLGYPVGSLLSVPLMERVQRKWLVCGAAGAMVVLGLGFGFTTSPTLIVAFGFLYTCASNFFSNSYHAYEVELFPTAVRATAAGTAYSISRLTNAAIPLALVPLLAAAGPTALFGVIVAAMVIVIVDVAALGPRTTGRALETITAVPVPESAPR